MTTVEREAEQERLAAALAAAAGGEGRLVVIEAAPGMGKSRLVDDVRALAGRQGFGRIKAVGDEPEQALPWGVVRQLVERSALRYAGEVRQAILAGPAGDALRALDEVPEPGADEVALARTLHRLWWVAADLSADRPLLITVDDAQWSDEPSLRFCAYLARRLADLPIALVVATRPVTATEGPLAELTAARGGERLRPAPLSPAGVAALLADGGAPDERVAAAVHEASGGNPFFAEQLAEELRHRGLDLTDPRTAHEVGALGPSPVSRVVLARCSGEARALAAAAAVLGGRSAPPLAARLAGLEEPQARRAGDELRSCQLLRQEPDELAFVHPVLRESVLASIPPAERAGLHAVAALALREDGASEDRVASHLMHAPAGVVPDETAVLERAGLRALGEGDGRSAARLLERARDRGAGAPALEATLGRALLRAGRADEARRTLHRAAEGLRDDRERAAVLAAAAEATLALDGPAAAHAELRAERERWAGDPGGALVLDARLAVLSTYALGGAPGSDEHLQRFADLPGDTAEERILLAVITQRALNEGRPAADVRRLALRALGSGALFDDLRGDLLPWGLAAFALTCTDAVPEADAEFERATAQMREGVSPGEFAVVAMVGAQAAWRRGDMRGCESHAVGGMDAAALMDPGPARDALLAVATRIATVSQLDQAEPGRARETLRIFDERTRGAAMATVPVERVRFARAMLALYEGEPGLALAEVEALRAAEDRAGTRTPATPAWTPWALALGRLGRDDEALRVAEEWCAVAQEWGASTDVGASLRLLARFDGGRRLDLLREAVAVLEQAPDRLELAAALADLGSALGAANRRSEARDTLNRGLELAEACVARSVSSRAVDALSALGDRPRRHVRSGVDELTASERRVARLAAEGHSNREIAQELFVTPKTVENHLRHAYAKLGVAGRRELAGVLAA